MKKRTKVILALSVACMGTLLLGACASNAPYKDLYEEGNGATVRFDANGGEFAGTDNIDIVIAFPTEQVQRGIKLIEPGDDRYGSEKTITTPSRTGYFLAGWYAGRELRVDENGNPLDVYGEPCDAENQAYIYSDPWDFEKDVFQRSELDRPEDGKYTLTLYAAWVPEFVYKTYAQGDDGWTEVGNQTTFDPLVESDYSAIPIPVLNEETGAVDYGRFPQYDGHTFEAAYYDAEKTQAITESVVHGGEIDYEHGIAINPIKNIYVDWKDGVWYEIHTAEQFIKNASPDGCYNIYENLDFTDLNWSSSYASSSSGFSGKILAIGGKKTFSNISFTQTNNQSSYNGIFSRITEKATIQGISFENVTYTVSAGTRLPTAYFGLFAGSIAEKASIEDVTVKGCLKFGNVATYFDNYVIGLLSGIKYNGKIDYEIDCAIADEMFGTQYYYPCIVTVYTDDDTVVLSKNEHTSVKPEVRYETKK